MSVPFHKLFTKIRPRNLEIKKVMQEKNRLKQKQFFAENEKKSAVKHLTFVPETPS